MPTPIPGNTIRANFQCNIPIGAKDGELFRPVLNGHGLFGTADQVNSDSLYALGSFGLMACATDEIGMAQRGHPERGRGAAESLELPLDPGPAAAGARSTSSTSGAT